ncbi:MAG: putative DNA binding domain-containing protein [Bacteroidales bacterium]|nr:putative DNA binding domain-containing protein [Bacteroidales bacterium]
MGSESFRISLKNNYKKTIEQMTQAELDTILQEGEGYYLEFKESVNSDLAKEMTAFANSSGGRILIGIDDDNNQKGVTINNDLKSRIQTIARDCDPSVNINLETFQNILIIHILEGIEKPYRCNKGFYIRNGASTQKMNTNQIVDFLQQEGRIKFDEQSKIKTNYKEAYSPELLRTFLKIAGIPQIMEDEDILRNLGVLNEDISCLNNAGIMFFTEKPGDYINQCIVTCVLYKGTEKVNILDRKDINTDFISTINESIIFLTRHLNVSYKIESIQRQDILEIPEVALREAVINAVMHRNYFEDGANVMIEIFDDRVEISNPGGLPKALDQKDFGKKSIRRNPLIANLFQRARFIEKLGTGINRMKNEVLQAGLAEPQYEFTGFFTIIFNRLKNGEPLEKNYPETTQKTAQKILDILKEHPKAGRKEIAEILGDITEDGVKYHIDRLKKEGILIRVGPNKGGYWEIKIR